MGSPSDFASFAKELVQANVDLIITQAAEAVDAARKATNTIPIVMAAHGDAVGAGIVVSLARPGVILRGKRLLQPNKALSGWSCSSKFIPSWFA